MNLELLKSHIENAVTNMVKSVPELKKDGSNSQDFFCADVIGGRRFVQNAGGYPRSEIAEINAQANLQAQMNLLQDLEDYSPKSNPNAGLSDAQIMLSHKSKYQQAPSELQDWLGEQIRLRDAVRYQAAQKTQKDAAKKGAEVEKPDTSVVVEPE